MIRPMGRIIFILSVSFGSISAGYILRRFVLSRRPDSDVTLKSVSRRLKLSAFFFMNPVALLSTFWGLKVPDSRVLALPLLGFTSVLVGMFGAMAAIRLMKIPPFRAGSIFTCGTFSNILTMGGLVAYTMFREPGYALVQLFTMAMSPVYYLLGYPIAANVGHGRKPVFRISAASLKDNPFLFFPLAAIFLGLGVRATGLPRPEFLADVVSVIVPSVAATLGLAIGLTLRFTGIGGYIPEIAVVLAIRHLLLPVVMIPAGILIGFGGVSGGLALKVIIIVSVMPVAFNALVPPALYGFDLDLANSAWIASTACLGIIVPVLFLVFRFF